MGRTRNSRGNGNHPISITVSRKGRKLLRKLRCITKQLPGHIITGRSTPQRSKPGIYRLTIRQKGSYCIVTFQIRTRKGTQNFLYRTHLEGTAKLFYKMLVSTGHVVNTHKKN